MTSPSQSPSQSPSPSLPLSAMIDELSNLFSPPTLHTLSDVGIFTTPPPPHLTSSAALRHTPPHLGLALWSLSPLYIAAKQRLLRSPPDPRAATAMLLVCPDHATAWNVRKSALLGATDVCDELKFCALVLMRSPKSAETWAHRAWVLRWVGKGGPVEMGPELELAWVAASRTPNNYYAGVHRLKVLGRVGAEDVRGELWKSRKWLRSHVSDSSGWWYQRLLVGRLGMEGWEAIREEVEYAGEMHERYKGTHQCVRTHWRWVSALQTEKGKT